MLKIKRLFIANRGEIARRIATTARRLGIETAALTDRRLDAGRAGPPAYLLGVVTHFVQVDEESPAVYLDADRMVRLAREAGCDALHPGFGFLSENAAFAEKVIAAGLTWVGPSPKSIDAMASKATARAFAEKAGVPCVRGLSGFPVPTDATTGDWSALERFAGEAGYPLLIKAAMGGGGKGMRQVHRREELREAALRAHSEAKNSFGDGSLICEQYLTAPRHVEVQILADKHGTVLAIGDRDCSVQRRHQKVLEEAPAPGLSDATRKAIHEAAVRLAAGVGYDSTGTVEFLVDWSDASRHAPQHRFFFLEMNTRLQVEHPVTEEVFGLDLVEWQLRVAGGETLPDRFRGLQPRGHSIEARLYAEDATQGFFPAPGPVAAFKPAMGPGLRWETGLDDADRITGRFDPMVAKLIATGETRAVALARMAEGLRRTFFAGPATNIELVHELTTRSDFAEGPVTTHYMTSNLDALLGQIAARRQPHEGAAADLLGQLRERRLGAGSDAGGGVPDPARLTAAIFAAGAASGVGSSAPASGATLPSLTSTTESAGDPGHFARSGQGWYHGAGAFWYAALTTGSERHYWITIDGCAFRVTEAAGASRRGAGGAGGAGAATDVVAPVPGKVIAVKVAEGQEVEEDTPAFVLESMKMEFEVRTRRAGCIGAVLVKLGEQVAAGQRLAEWGD